MITIIHIINHYHCFIIISITCIALTLLVRYTLMITLIIEEN